MSRSNVARLLVSCPDREGIIAALSSALRDAAANIISSDQFSSDPHRLVLARAVSWHLQDRILLQGHRTIIF
jgi:formyltetrahydrofolate deformylase